MVMMMCKSLRFGFFNKRGTKHFVNVKSSLPREKPEYEKHKCNKPINRIGFPAFGIIDEREY
jgi:hypothetical protein